MPNHNQTLYSLAQLQSELADDNWPQLLAWTWNKTNVALHLSISDGISWFTGHFPEQPILPGVVQTHWAAELAKKLFAIDSPFTKIHNLKFKNVITPQTELALYLSYKIDKQLVSFQYQKDEKIFSSGRIEFQRNS